jgi:hypothetical protein
MLVIPALERLKVEDHKFKVSLGSTDPVPKRRRKKTWKV